MTRRQTGDSYSAESPPASVLVLVDSGQCRIYCRSCCLFPVSICRLSTLVFVSVGILLFRCGVDTLSLLSRYLFVRYF